MKKTLLSLLAGILLAGCSSQPAPITQVFAFGDGPSDNGNFLGNLKEDVANGVGDPDFLAIFEPYYTATDRFSNGPVAVEVMADKLKADLTDYAVFGALSDDTSFVGDEHTGLLGQIDQFEF